MQDVCLQRSILVIIPPLNLHDPSTSLECQFVWKRSRHHTFVAIIECGVENVKTSDKSYLLRPSDRNGMQYTLSRIWTNKHHTLIARSIEFRILTSLPRYSIQHHSRCPLIAPYLPSTAATFCAPPSATVNYMSAQRQTLCDGSANTMESPREGRRRPR
jgi:hypothetical protein